MKRIISNLVKEYNKVEKKIGRELEKLKNYGEKCECEDENSIDLIFGGDWNEIHTYCLECGGYISQEEML